MIFSTFERKLASRYLSLSRKGQKRETFITVIGSLAFLGIMLGVATLIIVMSVMNGFRSELIGKILGFNGDIGIYAFSGPLVNSKSLEDQLMKIKGIAHVNPVIEGQAMVVKEKAATGVLVRGINAQDLMVRPLIADNMRSGDLQSLKGKDTILIGSALSRKMGVDEGDILRLMAPEVNVTAFGSVPRYKDYRIIGVFESGNNMYDAGVVFISLEAAQTFYRYPQNVEKNSPAAVSNLEVFLKNREDLDTILPNLIAATNGSVRIVDWRHSNKPFFEAIMTERNVMFIILTLIILIAAFNIISSMIILVKDKTKDIGILRTMGATRASILKIFFLTGASIGFFGTCAGVFLGLIFCFNIEHIRHFMESLTGQHLFNAEIYFLSKLPAIVQVDEVLVTVLTSLSITFIFTIIPAWRAARLDPVEALRYE
ncbi:MAG: lipoprotein-releasing ABC transporter permease subunit [Proteobacteria bacterium]|nr:lipoprotein-releasing ABC transporter permease subunit [Pseudomonadota bacterium]